MREPTRSAWSRPELIVLVRSGPEEAVLTSCKTAAQGTDQGGTDSGCFFISPCSDCKSDMAS